MASVPRTLSELLSGLIDDLGAQLGEAYKNLDPFIAQDHWTKEFQIYLRKRSLEEEEQIFRFLILTEIVLQYEKLITNDQNKKNTKQSDKLKCEQRQVFDYIMINFFSEESEDQIALSNQKLFDIMSSYAENAGSEQNLSEEMINHLKKAERDSKVWSEGLDPIYMNFLKQTNTSRSAMACLLSIL